MRTIKFRGKRTDNGEWVYGDLIHGQGSKYGRMYILPQSHIYPKGCNDLDGWNVIPETRGQFIGIFDKNITEIYEDDQVLKNGIVYRIVYNHLHACWGLFTENGGQSNEEILCDICDSKGNTSKQWIDSTLEVIGNIHDKTSDQ